MNELRIFFKKSLEIPVLGMVLRHRFIKFGIVGLTGMLVSLAVLYLGQEVLFEGIRPEGVRLNLSLALAILVATVSNYTWNRLWTWRDRTNALCKSFILQMCQYFVACWLAIALQFLFTEVLADHAHYLMANMMAIALAAFANFVINDIWTFAGKRRGSSDHPRMPYEGGCVNLKRRM